jgi:hypothetical protein
MGCNLRISVVHWVPFLATRHIKNLAWKEIQVFSKFVWFHKTQGKNVVKIKVFVLLHYMCGYIIKINADQGSARYQSPMLIYHHSCLVIGKTRVRYSACRSAILTEYFRGFPQTLYVNDVITLKHYRLIPFI